MSQAEQFIAQRVIIYSSLAAAAATWPANAATNAFKPVMADISEYSPLVAEVRGDVSRVAVV
jgi:hypothetical protein